jgi:sugar lactone lactonase YvrE
VLQARRPPYIAGVGQLSAPISSLKEIEQGAVAGGDDGEVRSGALPLRRHKECIMPANNYLLDVLETTEAERLATGFIFTEGPLWHPEGYWYFVDIRQNKLFRLSPGKEPEVVRNTIGGNGTTFDLQGRLIVCEGDDRRLTRTSADGKVESLVDNYKGGRFNRPNDVICHSNGCLYFTDPDKRRPYHEREIPGPEGDNNLWDGACVYRLAPDSSLIVLAHCEYPNGLALSPDERTMYVANTRSSQYIHAKNAPHAICPPIRHPPFVPTPHRTEHLGAS